MPYLRDGTYLNPMDPISEIYLMKNTYIRSPLIEVLLREVQRGVDQYKDYTDLDQAKLVIGREYQELVDEIDVDKPDLTKVWAEAMQVAATAIRLVEEIERRTIG